MPNILLIETATEVCSVALVSGEEIVACKESAVANAHSSSLSGFIEDVLKPSGVAFSQLDAVAVSSGPGSYTGLRIGVSSAKGICYALNIPLIAINTLESMAYGAKMKNPEFEGLFCPMIDARRMEVYSAFFDNKLQNIHPTSADIIDAEIYSAFLNSQKVLFFGNGAPKCQAILNASSNAFFDLSVKPSAKGMLSQSLKKYNEKDFEDVAYFEPFYLKDFVAANSKVKGL